uniref:Uncharacterized protein n=1 Tax=Zonotrichia albicollis TaxID=44394 RepID=A0A8D2M026_ZONAL
MKDYGIWLSTSAPQLCGTRAVCQYRAPCRCVGPGGSMIAGSGNRGARGCQCSLPVWQSPLDRLDRARGPMDRQGLPALCHQ